jgi:hypothetical protein
MTTADTITNVRTVTPGFGQLVDRHWIGEQVVLDPQGALDDL